MNTLKDKLIARLTEKPKMLFLIDALGAFLSAFFLFLIALHWSEYFGIPKQAVVCLAVLAICLCMYSAICFLVLSGAWMSFICIMGIANFLYCVSTIGLLVKYAPLLTKIGGVYFGIEIVIICGLVYTELYVAKEIRKKGGGSKSMMD